MNTNLSALEVAKLSALIVGGGYKRSATKAEAVAKFEKLATEAGIHSLEITTVLGQDFENAHAHLAAIKRSGSALAATGKGGAGLARLRKAPDAETIRQSTVSDAEAARAKVREQQDDLKIIGRDRRTGMDAFAPAPKAKAPKTAKAKAPAATRAPKSDLSATFITGIVENPKKAGSKASTIFALYHEGISVADFVAKVVKAGYEATDALANVSWDRRKGFIKTGPKAAAKKAA